MDANFSNADVYDANIVIGMTIDGANDFVNNNSVWTKTRRVTSVYDQGFDQGSKRIVAGRLRVITNQDGIIVKLLIV